MLGKLIKYEWKALIKPLSILYLVLLGITILTGILILTINPSFDDVTVGLSVLMTMLCAMLYYFGVIACSFGTLLIIAIRFYKTCYTDEAYLTHTLPVSTKELVGAKTIASVLAYMVSTAFIFLTMVLLIVVAVTHIINLGEIDMTGFSQDFWEALVILNEDFAAEMGVSFTGYLGYIGGFSLVSSISGIVIVLGCVSLGQLYTKHRILGAIIAYFCTTTLLQIVAYIGIIPMYINLFKAEYTGETILMMDLIGAPLWLTLIASVILAVVMHFVNMHMMTKRLNLE